MQKRYDSDEKKKVQLDFINTFNTAGPGLEPHQFGSVESAKEKLSAPFFWTLFNKLNVHEMARILDVIQKNSTHDQIN